MNMKLSSLNQKQITWTAITAITLSYFTLKMIKEYKHHQMIKICKKKRNARDQDIQKYIQLKLHCSLSEEIKTKILRSSIAEIKQMLYDGQFTVKQLLLLYIERTLNIGLKLNLLTDINFIKSLEEADEMDKLIQQDKNIINQYELFGIPISVKDTIQQQGFDTTFGLASRCFNPEPYDSLQIAHLKQAKALCFVRSNVPQCVMMFETDNNIFGQAQNPWNHSRTTGGTSGGEAGLVVSGCSVIGLGADMGGSIRIPSSFCGAYGFVPTVGRVSSLGEGLLKGPTEGIMNVKCSKGPIGKCVDDLIIFTKVLLSKEYYSKILRDQPQLQDFYWNPTELGQLPNKKLRIGVIHQFDQLIPPNCMKRGVKEAAQALLQQGHEIVDFKLDQKFIFKYTWIFLNIITAEGGFRKFYDILEGEKPLEIYSLIERTGTTPNWIRKYILSLILKLAGQNTIYNINKNTIPTDVYGYQVRSGIQREMTLEFLNSMKSQNIDALILPGFGLPAIKHFSAKQLPMVGLYTWIWNTMNVPIGSMPITIVQNQQDKVIEGKENSFDMVYREMNRNLKDSEGLPINIQVMSYPYKDEIVLKIMKDIEQEIKFNVKHPYPM